MAVQNGEASVSGGSHPVYLAFSFLGILIFWAFLRADLDPVFFRVPSLRRRLSAFALDFLFSMMCTAPIAGLIMLAVEYERTGQFQWQFYRETVAWTDSAVGTPLVIVNMLFLVLHFVYPLTRGKPTIGCYLVGIALAKEDQMVRLSWGQAIKRTLFEMIGASTWPYLIFVGKDRQGRTWYDRKSGFSLSQFKGEASFGRIPR